MKKIYLIVVFALTFISNLQAQDSPAGFIRKIRGKMVILNSKSQVIADTEGKRGRTIKENSPFYLGETLKTLADSRVKIEFVEGGAKGKNESVLGPNTTLVISRTSTTDNASVGTELILKDGDIRNNVKKTYGGKNGNEFLVRTPNAVAGVRGTIFSVFYSAVDKKSQFAVEQGKIFAANIAKSIKDNGGEAKLKISSEVEVESGMFTEASGASQNIEKPKPMSENPEIQKKVQSLTSDDRTGAFQSEEGSFADKSDKGDKRDDKGSSGTGEYADNAPLMRQPDDGSGDVEGRNPANFDSKFNDGEFIDFKFDKEDIENYSNKEGPNIDVGDLYDALEGKRNDAYQQVINETYTRTSLTIHVR